MYNLKQTGNCVKRLRGNMTQQEFADQAHIPLDTVRKIEQGRRGMSIDMLIDIADFFKVSTDYLLCRNNRDNEMNTCLSRLKTRIDELISDEIKK